MHLKLFNFHAAYAAIIIAIKNIICYHFELATKNKRAVTNFNGTYQIMNTIHSNQLTFISQTRCNAVSYHFVVMVMVFGPVTTLFQLFFRQKISTRYSSEAFVHFGHSVMFYCFISIFGICMVNGVLFFVL